MASDSIVFDPIPPMGNVSYDAQPVYLIDQVREHQNRRRNATDVAVSMRQSKDSRHQRAHEDHIRRERDITSLRDRRISTCQQSKPVLLVDIAGQIQTQRNAVEMAAKALERFRSSNEKETRSSPLKKFFSGRWTNTLDI